MNYDKIVKELRIALDELWEESNLEPNDLIVFGCSTSEILGNHIGSNGSEELGILLCDEIFSFCKSRQIHPCFQCCEHLNRSLIISKTIANIHNFTMVNVKPQIHAGGALATAAYNKFVDPVAVQFVMADAGVDIGDTLIGMHLKPVAVPFRPSIPGRKIGMANLVMAYTRLPYVGGPRAIY